MLTWNRFQSDEWYSAHSILNHWPCPRVSRCIRTPPSRPPQVQIVAKQIIVCFCLWAAAPFTPRAARSGRESQREGGLSENAGDDDFHRSGFHGSPWHHQLCGTLVAGLASAPSVRRMLGRSGYARLSVLTRGLRSLRENKNITHIRVQPFILTSDHQH